MERRTFMKALAAFGGLMHVTSVYTDDFFHYNPRKEALPSETLTISVFGGRHYGDKDLLFSFPVETVAIETEEGFEYVGPEKLEVKYEPKLYGFEGNIHITRLGCSIPERFKNFAPHKKDILIHSGSLVMNASAGDTLTIMLGPRIIKIG